MNPKSLMVPCFVFAIFLMFSIAPAQQSPSDTCLTFNQVKSLLKAGIRDHIIIEKVQQYRVKITLNANTTAQLVQLGANEGLLKAIENNLCSSINILVPRNGEECGAALRVEGKTVQMPGKFLWVFIHAKYLREQWRPQVGAIKVTGKGDWSTMVYLGNPRDIGNNFEIAAVWVDEKEHQRLKKSLHNTGQSGHPPSIKLPRGEPLAKVTVKKVRH